jgi:hypothetical protein
MIAEVIDPVTGAVQLVCIKRQIRGVEATNIRMMDLLLVIYPSIGRLQTRDVGRQTFEKIMGWNYRLRIIFRKIASASARLRIVSIGRMRTSTCFK